MKALILAAGYATRLYPLTLDTPKPLLKLKDKSIIDYIVEKIEKLEYIDQIIIVSNNKFYNQFEDWLNMQNNSYTNGIKLINDGSNSPQDKLGAVMDIEFVIKQEAINDDLLVIAGDNLFGFDLMKFIIFSNLRKPCHSICLHPAFNNMDLSGFGIAELNGKFEILNFEEKPPTPKSHFVATCIYFLPKQKLNLISLYLNLGNHNDTPGSYIKWLTQNDLVYGYICNGSWYDLGDFDTLTHALINLNWDKPKVMNH